MYRRWAIYLTAFLWSFVLFACTPSSTQTPQASTSNPAEATVSSSPATKQESAKRVVALTSLSADIIYQLDKTKLVGITGSSLFKNDPRFKDIPRMNEGQTPPNLEKIVALKPDLVIGAEGFSNQTTNKLKQLNIPTLLTKINSWESLQELTRTLAQKVGADPQGLLSRYQSFITTTKSNSANPKILLIVQRQPILAPNKNSWAGDLLNQFKLANVAAELQGKSPIGGYVTLSAEKVLETDPEVIITVNPPQGRGETELLEALKKEPFWNKLQATKNSRVYSLDYYGLVNAGSIDAIEKACKELSKIANS
jgi:iron complex transport system substrate-binding protein